VFAIGTGLREARERQGLSLEQAAEATRIAARHLRALEEERFERLPEPVYARGFLREYADFLGLDARPFLDEYTARLGEPEPPPLPSRARRRPIQAFRLRRSGGAVALTLAVVLVALLAWRFGGSGGQQANPVPLVKKPSAARARPRANSDQAQPRPPARRKTPQALVAQPALARVILTASNGRCWLDAHQGSAAGKQLYIGVLEQGQTARLQGSRLWIRLGAPDALTATLNGRRLTLPNGTANLIVTASGIHPA
jgi:cytoskeletal protein RodZ